MHWRVVVLFIVGVVGLSLSVQAAGSRGAKVGGEAYVCCKKLPVHKEPSAYSPIVLMLDFGCPATLVGDVKVPSKGEGKKDAKTEAAWFKIEVDGKQGYVPARCMVSERALRRQDPNRAATKAQDRPNQVAGKGFSETEDGDLNALKGMAGSAKSSEGADYAAIDAILTVPPQYDPKNAYADFRKEGQLGEFAHK